MCRHQRMTILHPVPIVATIVTRITIILASSILVVPWSPESSPGPALPGPRLIVGLFLFHACLPLLRHHLAETITLRAESSMTIPVDPRYPWWTTSKRGRRPSPITSNRAEPPWPSGPLPHRLSPQSRQSLYHGHHGQMGIGVMAAYS
jgi:hypothetical protein